MSSEIKCKKCRVILLEDIENNLISAHGISDEVDLNVCNSLGDKNMLHLNQECVPTWIKAAIETENWTRGKLNCSQCNNRVGSFDFVSGKTCECGKHVLPPVHFIKSKVDYFKL